MKRRKRKHTDKTCHTFETEAEASAFMLGFSMAASDEILACVDQEEPQTVLIDVMGDDAQEVFRSALNTYRQHLVWLSSLGVLLLFLSGCASTRQAIVASWEPMPEARVAYMVEIGGDRR